MDDTNILAIGNILIDAVRSGSAAGIASRYKGSPAAGERAEDTPCGIIDLWLDVDLSGR